VNLKATQLREKFRKEKLNEKLWEKRKNLIDDQTEENFFSIFREDGEEKEEEKKELSTETLKSTQKIIELIDQNRARGGISRNPPYKGKHKSKGYPTTYSRVTVFGEKNCKNCRGTIKGPQNTQFLECACCKAFIHHYCSYVNFLQFEDASLINTFCRQCVHDDPNISYTRYAKNINPNPDDAKLIESQEASEKEKGILPSPKKGDDQGKKPRKKKNKKTEVKDEEGRAHAQNQSFQEGSGSNPPKN